MPTDEQVGQEDIAKKVRRFTPGFMGAVVAAMGARVRDAEACGRFPEEIREVQEQRRADFVLAQELADAMPVILAFLASERSMRERVERLEGAVTKIANGTEDNEPPFRSLSRDQMVVIARKALSPQSEGPMVSEEKGNE